CYPAPPSPPRVPPRPTALPYTTLFRSCRDARPATLTGRSDISHARASGAVGETDDGIFKRDLPLTLGGRLEPAVDAKAPAPTHRSEDTRLNYSHQIISYAVFCLKKKNK